MTDRTCAACGADLAGKRADARFCSASCRSAGRKRAKDVQAAPAIRDEAAVPRETEPPPDPIGAQHWDPRAWHADSDGGSW